MAEQKNPDEPSGMRNLTAGLQVAFGPDSEAPRAPAHSILAAIEKFAGTQSRVMLRDPTDEHTPVVATRSNELKEGPGEHGRYQVIGEIARGGVGVILKARDSDLGRDLAIKVLLSEHTGTPAMMQRFVEEAQIGAQLQHPGIVPVYNLGLRPDQRPYFTMKLVKGKTFSAMLQARSDPAEDRQRNLHVLEKVSQTMAYAHARGVIHRDLKPANLMVGAFGEVLVVDWGFAKVLGAGGVDDERKASQVHKTAVSIIETIRSAGVGSVGSQSVAGSLMGTPAYMPPEQALGDIAHLDERSDVFSLGAVLCEILTGLPPYVAETPTDVVVMAAEGKIDDAYKRLEKCGADEELIRLSKRCLSPTRAVRPESAAFVADAMGAHFAGVEKRAREAEIKAIKAKAEAKAAGQKVLQERKARRLTLSLAASVLLTVVVVGGGWVWMQSGAAARLAESERTVSAALEEAEGLRGLAKGAAVGDMKNWSEALGAAKRADALAASGEIGTELRSRVDELLAALAREQAAAQSAADLARKDVATVAQLEEIRSSRGEEFDLKKADAAYTTAFLEYGIDVDSLPAAAAGKRMRASAIQTELIGALDDWIVTRSGAGAKRLHDAVREADPDPWRSNLRQAAWRDDRLSLRTLASSADMASLSVNTVDLLASSLARAGELERAIALWREARRRHPQDFWVSYNLAFWLTKQDPPKWEEAVRYYTAALTLRPKSVATLNNRATVFLRTEETDAAVQDLQRALFLKPDYARAQLNLAKTFSMQGKVDDAIEAYKGVLRQQPESALVYNNLAQALEKKGDRNAAIDHYRQALRKDSGFEQALANLIDALAKAGRLPEAEGDCAAVIQSNGKAHWAHHAAGYVYARTRRPREAVEAFRKAISIKEDFAKAHIDMAGLLWRFRDFDGALKAYRRALELDPKDFESQSNVGFVYMQMGRPHRAVPEFRKALAINPDYWVAHDSLGVALMRLGNTEDAIPHYAHALRLRPDLLRTHRDLGRALAARSTVDGAIAYYRGVVREPGKAAAMFFLGLGRGLNDRWDLDGFVRANLEGLRVNPDSSALNNSLGNAHARKGDREKAKQCFRKAIALSETNVVALGNLGDTLRREGDLDGARKLFERAIDAQPRNAGLYMWMVLWHLQRGALDDAVSICGEAIALAPDVPRAHYSMGWGLGIDSDLAMKAIPVYVKAYGMVVSGEPSAEVQSEFFRGLGARRMNWRDPDKALVAYGKALELQPKNPVLLNQASFAHEVKQDTAKAIQLARRAVDARPLGYYRYRLARLLFRTGQHEQADDIFRALHKLAPDAPVVCNALAAFLATCPDASFRKPDQAVRLARKAVRLAPGNWGMRHVLGVAHYRAGAYRESLVELSKAAELRPGGASAGDAVILAMAHWRQGNKDEARNWLAKSEPRQNNQNAWLVKLQRAEAAELLGVK